MRLVQGKRPSQEPLGRPNFVDDFSTGFSFITRDGRVSQTCKLAQKFLHTILRRMVYILCGNKQYLKSQFGVNGHFPCILGFFPDFLDFVAAKRWAGPMKVASKASDFRHQMALLYFHQNSNRFHSFNFNLSIFIYFFNLHINYLNWIFIY